MSAYVNEVTRAGLRKRLVPVSPEKPFTRWDEKVGLRRDAIRSQRLTRSRRNGKETGYDGD